jgi:hypothetical protein
MIEYANEKVTKSLKQYDMLLKSLKYIPNNEEKSAIYYQMTKITEQILKQTNEIYERQYNKLESKKTFLMEEERNKLLEIINLINERKAYINNQIKNNREVTALDIQAEPILGEDMLEEYKKKVKIIEKYNQNLKTHASLVEEIEELKEKITKAKAKIESNKYLNIQLENKMKKILSSAFEKLNLYELKERVKEIDLAYTELGYSLEKAKENAKLARKSSAEDIIIECDNMLSSITLEYERYKEKKLILKLMDIYDNEVKTYDELLAKREIINNILSNIVSSELYLNVGSELNKQYNTIKLEKQDTATLDSLNEEKNSKSKLLFNIEEENTSAEFAEVLKELLSNERKHQQQILEEKKKQEEEKKRQQLLEEKRKQEEKLKQQQLLEEQRNKEIEKRTRQLLEEKQKSILSPKEDSIAKLIKKEVKPMPSSPKTVIKPTAMPNNTEKKPVPSRLDARPEKNESNTKLDNFSKIPVIKNNNLNNQMVETKKVDIPSIPKPVKKTVIEQKEPISKEDSIFPDIPVKENTNDSFFDDDELKDLNNYMESDSRKNWF